VLNLQVLLPDAQLLLSTECRGHLARNDTRGCLCNMVKW